MESLAEICNACKSRLERSLDNLMKTNRKIMKENQQLKLQLQSMEVELSQIKSSMANKET